MTCSGSLSLLSKVVWIHRWIFTRLLSFGLHPCGDRGEGCQLRQLEQRAAPWCCSDLRLFPFCQLCTKQEDWKQMGEVFRSLCRSSQHHAHMERISGHIAVALLSESKDKLTLPFAAFADTCKRDGSYSQPPFIRAPTNVVCLCVFSLSQCRRERFEPQFHRQNWSLSHAPIL